MSDVIEGPDRELRRYYNLCMNTPLSSTMSLDESVELGLKIQRTATIADLDDETADFLRRCWAELQAGLSPTLYDPSEWAPDWSAEDAAGGDEPDPPGWTPGDGPVEAKGVDFDEPDDDEVSGDLPGVDDDGWVGV